MTEQGSLYDFALKSYMNEFGLSPIKAYIKAVSILSKMQGFEYSEHVTNLNRSLLELVGKKQGLKTITNVRKKLKIKPQQD